MKDIIISKLTSRKFLMAVAGIAGSLLFAVSGEMTLADAMDKIQWIILAYLGAEGAADTAGRLRG